MVDHQIHLHAFASLVLLVNRGPESTWSLLKTLSVLREAVIRGQLLLHSLGVDQQGTFKKPHEERAQHREHLIPFLSTNEGPKSSEMSQVAMMPVTRVRRLQGTKQKDIEQKGPNSEMPYEKSLTNCITASL